MQLKKIEVQGFKSFAGKTAIDFLDGITTIVGPNGSGKSNIADSVRWVLGEQSAKVLRGAKMEDVIFSGTENRKKVGFAEVSIYLDNSDGSLPIEYSEVVVTRRVFRSGESNYLINGAECRLKDVQELFLDTGIGKDGYSIIGQGKIDEILSNKSEERRAIFEEASGIMKYKTRKDEATRKLENSESSLTRVNDILVEIENIIKPLEEKCEKAKQFLNLRDKLKASEVCVFLRSLKENAEVLTSLDSRIEIFQNDINLEEKDAIELEKAKLNLKERQDEIILKIEQSQAKFFELENNIEKINSKVSLGQTNIENNSQHITRLEEEIAQDLKKISTLSDEVNIKIEKKESLNLNKQKFENELKEKQLELNDILKTLDERGEYIESLKNNIEELEEKIDELNLSITSYEATIESNEKQLLNLEKNCSGYISEKDKLMLYMEDITKILSTCKLDLNNIELNEEKENKKLFDINDFVNKSKEKENNLNQEIMTKKSKYSYLTNLKNENEGYFKSVKVVLDYVKENNIKNVYSTVIDSISCDEKYERAIEVALGSFAQNIIVETASEAKILIEYLKNNSYGRATFMPLSNMKKLVNVDDKKIKNLEGYIAFATELTKYDKKYENVVYTALNSSIIVDTLDHANNIFIKTNGSLRIITLSGEVISPSGSITGGQSSSKTTGLLGREEKIKRLSEEIKQLEKEKEKLINESSETYIKQSEIENKLNEFKKLKDVANINIATNNEKLESIKKEISKIEEGSLKSDILKSDLNNEINKLKESIQKYNNDIDSIKIEILNKNAEIEEYERYNKVKGQSINLLNEDIVNLKISLSSFDESNLSIDEMKEKLELDIINFENAIENRNVQKEEFLKQIIKIKEEIITSDKEIENIIKFKEEYSNISEKLKSDKKEFNFKLDTLEIKMLESVNKIGKIKEEKAKIENRKIKFDIEIENLKNNMWDNYELTISSAKEYAKTLPDYEVGETSKFLKDADKIRNEIKLLGDVDVNSIDEYNTTKQRYDFILSQKNDLDETKKKLENLISNMTTLMKGQFSKQFEIINKNFSETFKELFGGGKASLSLTDINNILESGIEIEVQPPGKKLQSMMLLSGGERALTATALLFAILKIKAPPFCILDEIEAALDDINVQRFAEYIKKYSKDTQFIVITHRKGTMEVAKTVYGVTMEEYGVSKIISMKMN